jgi:S-adenosylmethionine synthetase
MNLVRTENVTFAFPSRPKTALQEFEVVERKGIGHPDTLCDAIAEHISCAYSRYCIKKYGVIPNHWVDKCTLIGGACDRSFGRGEVIRPLQIHVIGKVTHYIGKEEIPVFDIALRAVDAYLKDVFPHITQNDYQLKLFTNHNWGAGRPQSWYAPQTIDEICPPEKATANDAVICVAYAPLSPLERLTLMLEEKINGKAFKKEHPYIGTDVKVIACRREEKVHLTLCIPFIAIFTPTRDFYDLKKNEIIDLILQYAREAFSQFTYTVRINTRDDEKQVYMTHLGSAADTGDVGVVGRGNRMNGLITPNRPQSIEAPCGKNPVYHTGKIYSVLAQKIADDVAKVCGGDVEVYLTSETGNPLSQPAHLLINFMGVTPNEIDETLVREIVHKNLSGTVELTYDLIAGRVRLY